MTDGPVKEWITHLFGDDPAQRRKATEMLWTHPEVSTIPVLLRGLNDPRPLAPMCAGAVTSC